MKKFTVHQFNEMFPDEETCLDAVRDMLYPEGIACRQCNDITTHHRLSGRKAYSASIVAPGLPAGLELSSRSRQRRLNLGFTPCT